MISTIVVSDLFDRYPNLFQEFNGPFIVGEGWQQIVTGLCSTIDMYLKSIQPVQIEFGFLNIRSRFGILDIDYKGTDPIITSKFIKFAEKLSYRTCEDCGEPGYLHSSSGNQFGKFATLCQKDALRRLYKRV